MSNDSSPFVRLKPGTAIGPYAVQSRLGSGGMGEVYLARDARLHRYVAMKVLPPEFASDADRRRRFELEARAAASLNHPNIVSVYDVGLEDGTPFIIMEYVPGETLAALMRRERVSHQRALQIGSDIAAALVEAHAHQITHRDLKPANVMVTPGRVVKVLDFGIAKTLVPEPTTVTAAGSSPGTEDTHPGQLIGTPAYMSPEQLLGHPLDQRTDIYSLGVILFELVTGQRPFPHRDVDALRHAVLATATPPSARDVDPAVPEPIGDLIAHAMTRDAAGRPSAAILRAELDALARRSVGVQKGIPSVAVLSFADMSSGKDQEFFCDGMAEELINALTQIAGLRVAARTSAFQFKGKARDVRVIGQALDVATVLDGSVRKAGNRLRVSVELIDTANGYQLWSERFDRDLQDVFAVQDEIARSVVAALSRKLSVDISEPAVPQRPRDLEAYALYLEGRYHWNKRTEEELRKSVACFQQAVDRDGRYAPAYAGMADAYITLGTYGAMPARDVMPFASDALRTALAIDDRLAEAYACRGCLRSVYEWSWADAEQDFRKAIALNPNYPTAHHWFAINHLVPLGRFAEAEDALHRALALDPLALAIKTSLGIKSYFAGDYDRAVGELRKAIELDERFGVAHFFLGATYTEQFKYAEALVALNAAKDIAGPSSEILAALGYLHGRSGNVEAARQLLDDLTRASSHRYVSPARLAQVHLGLAQRAEALASLEAAYAERAADMAWLGVRPTLASLRTEPRFQRLLNLIGLAASQPAAGPQHHG